MVFAGWELFHSLLNDSFHLKEIVHFSKEISATLMLLFSPFMFLLHQLVFIWSQYRENGGRQYRKKSWQLRRPGEIYQNWRHWESLPHLPISLYYLWNSIQFKVCIKLRSLRLAFLKEHVRDVLQPWKFLMKFMLGSDQKYDKR